MNGDRLRWRSTLAALVLGLVSTLTAPGHAQTASIPASLQAELLAKLETYDRSYAARAGKRARVLIVVKKGSAKSYA